MYVWKVTIVRYWKPKPGCTSSHEVTESTLAVLAGRDGADAIRAAVGRGVGEESEDDGTICSAVEIRGLERGQCVSRISRELCEEIYLEQLEDKDQARHAE